MIASQRTRPDVVARREAFLVEVASIPADRLVFVDESGVVQGMRAAYGYAPRGERCVDWAGIGPTAPFRVGRRMNLLGWMRADSGGVVGIEGSVKADTFEQFVATSLVPSLRRGDVVIWDNARIHGAGSVARIESVGARVLAQPPYSPDLNAIEPPPTAGGLWSKVKGIVRQKLADLYEDLVAALDEAVSAVRPSDAAGWIRHCGYLCQPA